MADPMITPGRDFTITLSVLNKTKTGPLNLTGCALALTVGRYDDESADPLLTLAWSDAGGSDGISVPVLATGIATATLPATFTKRLDPGVRYEFAAVLTDAGGQEDEIARGELGVHVAQPPRLVITTLATATLGEVRRAVHDKLDDLIVLTADADGDYATIRDAQTIFDSSPAYVGSHLYFASGTPANVGRVARVIDGDDNFGLLSFEPPLPQPTQAGDVADLHNLSGSGWTRSAVVRRIQQKIAASFPSVLIGMQVSLPGTFNCRAPVIVAPPDLTHVSQPQWQDRGGFWEDVPPAHWRANPMAQAIEIVGPSARLAHGRPLRLIGYGQHPPVVNESDPILVDMEWLVLAAAADLASQRQAKRDQWLDWGKAADARLGDVITPRMPNTVRLR